MFKYAKRRFSHVDRLTALRGGALDFRRSRGRVGFGAESNRF